MPNAGSITGLRAYQIWACNHRTYICRSFTALKALISFRPHTTIQVHEGKGTCSGSLPERLDATSSHPVVSLVFSQLHSFLLSIADTVLRLSYPTRTLPDFVFEARTVKRPELRESILFMGSSCNSQCPAAASVVFAAFVFYTILNIVPRCTVCNPGTPSLRKLF